MFVLFKTRSIRLESSQKDMNRERGYKPQRQEGHWSQKSNESNKQKE